MDEPKKGTRRRGELLEEAILLSAWEELIETGYTDLTMESVATRAGTNKAVLYRRWDNKAELVFAAIRKYYFPQITNEIPNTGNLRDDVYSYLRSRVEPMRIIGAQTMRGLFMEPVMWRTIIAAMPQIIQRRPDEAMTTMMTILKNAELRGEIQLDKLMPHVISLPLDLLRYALITKLEPISDDAIAKIVDDIFIPLVHTQAGNGK